VRYPLWYELRAVRALVRRERTSSLLALGFFEYLTPQRLADASRDARLGAWRRHRVRYPLWYELRAVRALVRRERTPSRFDLWESVAT
jgi:hypothetical protein